MSLAEIRVTRRNVLFFKNCGYVHARRAVLDMHQRAEGGRRGRHLESMSSYDKSGSVNRCILFYV